MAGSDQSWARRCWRQGAWGPEGTFAPLCSCVRNTSATGFGGQISLAFSSEATNYGTKTTPGQVAGFEWLAGAGR